MKTLVSLFAIPRYLPSKAIFDNLVRICPKGQYPMGHFNPNVFSVRLSVDDPVFAEIRAYLESERIVPNAVTSGKNREPGEYSIRYFREYDRSDFRQALALVPQPQARAELAERQLELKDDLLHLEPKALKKKAAFQDYCWGWVVVRREVRDTLLQSDLKHVAFRSVKINSRDREWDTDELWELSSTFILPPVAPPTLLLHNDLTPFTGDHSKGLRYDEKAPEGYYSPPELHYRHSDLAGVAPFDLAYTREEFTGHFVQGYRKLRKLVASQRFYQFCDKHGFKTEWVPVRIDPD